MVFAASLIGGDIRKMTSPGASKVMARIYINIYPTTHQGVYLWWAAHVDIKLTPNPLKRNLTLRWFRPEMIHTV